MYESDITDEQWEKIKRILRPVTKDHEPREVVNAILYREKTGCVWEKLPREYPPPISVYKRWKRWNKIGMWGKVLDFLNISEDKIT